MLFKTSTNVIHNPKRQNISFTQNTQFMPSNNKSLYKIRPKQ